MIKGDTIVLVKDMGNLEAGAEFTVDHITNDGWIYFSSNFGTGFMTAAEYEQYFELKNTKKSRQWTQWTALLTTTMVNRKTYDFEWRTDKHKKIQVRVLGYGKAEANCSEEDTFDLRTGTAIAFYRMLKKICNRELEELCE